MTLVSDPQQLGVVTAVLQSPVNDLLTIFAGNTGSAEGVRNMDEREADSRETDALRPAADDAVVVSDLASDLRQIYDPTAAKSLPIYFGPLLGELFLANW